MNTQNSKVQWIDYRMSSTLELDGIVMGYVIGDDEDGVSTKFFDVIKNNRSMGEAGFDTVSEGKDWVYSQFLVWLDYYGLALKEGE